MRNMVFHGVALCTCGFDMIDHSDGYSGGELDHPFIAAGTKHRCGEWVLEDQSWCVLPKYHAQHGVECSSMLRAGRRLWTEEK